MNIPTKRFALSTVITDSDLLEYQGQEQLIKEHIEQGLLQRAQTILPKYPGYVITDPYFEADRDIQNCWTTVTFSFRLARGDRMTDKQLEFLKQWRDWHWSEHFKAIRTEGRIILPNHHRSIAHTLNEAIEILSGLPPVPPASEIHYKYGEWPE